MAAVAHGWHKPGGSGPSVAVAKDFNQADTRESAVNKGYQSKVESFAKGGPVIGQVSKFAKEGNVKNPVNSREDAAAKPDYGKFISGVDRFTSANLADAGEPANVRRTKPDEDWSKVHVTKSLAKRTGDSKSETPIKPRK
jgi:hypothetical protein